MNTKIKVCQTVSDVRLLLGVMKAFPETHEVRLRMEAVLFSVPGGQEETAVRNAWAIYRQHVGHENGMCATLGQ